MKKSVRNNRLYSFFIILIILVVLLSLYGRRLYKLIDNSNSSQSILSFLINGPKEEEIIYKPEETIQIIEGWTNRSISQYFESIGKWQSEELLELVGFPAVDYRKEEDMPLPKDFSNEFTFLNDKPKHYGLEGYLFPDTYRIYADASIEDVVIKMLDNFDKKLTAELREEITKQGKTVYEIITMASIIEKEAPITSTDDYDARVVSGIFWGRLKIGQALQSDATLSYLFNDNNPQHKGEELEVDSLYNTYKYRGLPPGPICNPGIQAIRAAIYPINTNYNYFLTPRDSQQVIYARTYEEHLQNKYKYLK